MMKACYSWNISDSNGPQADTAGQQGPDCGNHTTAGGEGQPSERSSSTSWTGLNFAFQSR